MSVNPKILKLLSDSDKAIHLACKHKNRLQGVISDAKRFIHNNEMNKLETSTRNNQGKLFDTQQYLSEKHSYAYDTIDFRVLKAIQTLWVVHRRIRSYLTHQYFQDYHFAQDDRDPPEVSRLYSTDGDVSFYLTHLINKLEDFRHWRYEVDRLAQKGKNHATSNRLSDMAQNEVPAPINYTEHHTPFTPPPPNMRRTSTGYIPSASIEDDSDLFPWRDTPNSTRKKSSQPLQN